LYKEAKHGTLKKRDWNRIQAAEMKYLRTAKGFARADRFRNEDTVELGYNVIKGT
jgi:hypothetical protein